MMKRIFTFLPLALIAGILLARFHIAIVRYFDVDEFAHMHWAWLVIKGYVPYKDFFFYNFLGFPWFLALLFLLPAGTGTVIFVRLFMFGMYAACAFFLYRLALKFSQKNEVALLTVFILVTFPMTFDKTIDIRTDIPMFLCILIASDLLLSSRQLTGKYMFLIGFLSSVSAFITFKIVFVYPALLYLLVVRKNKPTRTNILWGLIGLATPFIIYFLYLVGTGTLAAAIWSVTRDSVEVTAGKTPFSPWKALSPWPLVYVESGGPSWPWRVNTAIWSAAAAGLIIFFIKKPVSGLYFLLFYAAGIVFLFLFPAPYLQYFVPLSIYASFLAAYAVFWLTSRMKKLFPPTLSAICNIGIFGVVIVSLGISFLIQYRIRASSGNDNAEQMSVIRDVLIMTEPNDPIYDMVGSYIFRPDGYIFCCHPYAEFVDRLKGTYPTLRESLVERKTKFIILDRTGMSLWQPKPDDLVFLRANYLPSKRNWKIYPLGQKFLCTGGDCMQADNDNRVITGASTSSISIIIPELYSVSTDPANLPVFIDGKQVGSNPTHYEAGQHPFRVDANIRMFTIQLVR